MPQTTCAPALDAEPRQHRTAISSPGYSSAPAGPNAAGNPAPTREIPILIGGGGVKKTLRIVAEHGAAVGRDTARLVERSVEVSGAPEVAGEALVAAGATLLTTSSTGPDYDLSTLKVWLDWRDERR
ncbi:hypothetical protein APR04_003213 [Promicromonospora umidemergens]|uniref:Uncharacterized protein n=1 Tax=Promicromonospora umidemergens TaxID=629679 RepID=A0ABP8XYJ7_9MICO|nr:hypothetical protein [Promicromonospora umidemergens]